MSKNNNNKFKSINILNEITDNEESLTSNETDTLHSSITPDYNNIKTIIDNDVNHILIKLSEIQKHITTIDTIISSLETQLINEQDFRKKAYISKTISSYISQTAQLQEVYQKFLTIKYNYTAELNRLATNKHSLLIKSKEESGSSILSVTKLLNIFKQLNSSDSKTQLLTSVSDLSKNPSYNLE